jgi:hypothetical protein
VTHETITFNIKNENRKMVLKCIGIEDMGFIMRPPIGESIVNSLFGKTVIDPNGVEYKIRSIAVRQNILWLAMND